MLDYLRTITERKSLSFNEMKLAAEQLFSEEITDIERGAFLSALRVKGETPEEIAGLAAAIQAKSLQLPVDSPDIIDNCGTGGDGSMSFNISTTAAFVMAGAGLTVAKHGNRSVSSKTGSADVLEELGVNLSLSGHHAKELLEQNGITFLFAPTIHPAMKKLMTVRKTLRIPTVMNLIGPLTNPVSLSSQFLGINRADMVTDMAEVLRQLGRKRAIVVHGAGGMDAASLAGYNQLALLDQEAISDFRLHPEEIGLPVYPLEAIRGGDTKENATILNSVLRGEKGAYRDTTLLNAGLGIYANGKVSSLEEGILAAKESIDSGAANEKLAMLIEYSQRVKRGA